MLGVLVFMVLAPAVLAFYARAPERGWRDAMVMATLAWAFAIALVTEGLSLFEALRFWPVLIAWLGGNGVVLMLAARAWQRGTRPARLGLHSGFEWAVALTLVVLLGLALLVALVAPPNTADALSYHLPRQVMWLQQGSVRHFVTADDRALMMPPLAEMIQAHAMLLSGGDRWANFPQWIAYGFGIAVVSLLARDLGVGRRGQWLAALVFATLPMAYLEASSAKNDLMIAGWLAAFAWLALRLMQAGGAATVEWRAAGVALGLSLATKTTAFVFAAPVVVLLAPVSWRNVRRAWWLPVLVLVIVGPHWARNLAWYGTPLGIHRAEDGGAQGSEIYSWRGLLSNVARNTTLHTATPWASVNALETRGVARLHRGLNLSLNDWRITLQRFGYAVVWLPGSEVVAGAPAQWLLGVGAIVWLLARGPRRGLPLGLLLVIIVGALLECLLLKWQPWGARLHLPGFVLLAALIAWAADRAGRWAVPVVALVCVAGWLPSAQADARPWWTPPTIFATTRWENYFRYQPPARPLIDACVQAAVVAKVESLQIVTKHDFSYPLMKRFLAEAGPRAKIWGTLSGVATFPDGVVLMEPFGRWLPLYLRLPGAPERYRTAGVLDPIGLYLPESRARALAATLPLPRFVGWDSAENFGPLQLEPQGDGFWRGRRLLAAEARLGFRREAPQLSVQIEALNLSSVPCELELRLDGVQVAIVGFEPRATVRVANVTITPQHERGELSLIISERARPALLFTALRIID